MLNMLYTLKKEYVDKKIYIWNINRDSMVVFARAAFRGFNIQGFVALQEDYVGDTYMNRPVVSFGQVEQEEDSIILVSDEVMRTTINTWTDEKMIYWSEALEIDEELRHRHVILYSVDYWSGGRIDALLAKEGIKTELYCFKKKNYNMQQYKGKKVIEADELVNYTDCAVVISAEPGQDRQDMLEIMTDWGGGRTWVEYILGECEIINVNLVQDIELAIKKRKKIYLYSIKNIISELIEHVLSQYDIPISGYIDDEKDIYSLAFDGIEDKLIIINEENVECLVRARENVELAGFSLEEGNYTSIQWHTFSREILLSELRYYNDPLVGCSYLYEHGYPGWKRYGKEEDEIKILVLGGSTSAENSHPENWVRKLHNKLNCNNVKAVVYNGAYPANDIVDEILKLLRDGHALRPHIVISMSGVNNTCYKECVNQFNEDNLISWTKSFSSDEEYCSGICSDESLYSFWDRNMKILKVVAEFYGAVFLGFLQPMNITLNHMTLWEKSTYEIERHIIGARDFAQFANDGSGYINMMRLFEHQDDMYFDMCHYTDKAHEIIAQKVFERIMPILQTFE